jgi:hypothetical protein
VAQLSVLITLLIAACFASAAPEPQAAAKENTKDTKPAATADDKPPVDDPRGLVLVQETHMSGLPQPVPAQEMTIKFKGSMMRMDMPRGIGYMIRDANGDQLMVMHFNRTYTRHPSSSSKAKQAAESVVDPDAPKPEKPNPSGRTEKINGFEAQEYVGDFAGKKVSFWVAPKYPNADLIMAKMAASAKSEPTQKFTQGFLMPDPADLPKGVVVRTDMQHPNGMKTVITVKSAKLENIPDSEFQPPAGYTEQKIPAAPVIPQR